MSTTVGGVVTNGVVVPSSPLPEGAKVNISLQSVRPEVPPDLQEEFDDWERAGAGTIELIERLALNTPPPAATEAERESIRAAARQRFLDEDMLAGLDGQQGVVAVGGVR